ncbi:MAG: rhodanese-like domain-containing protein [Candidatus Entotheonellia bacterium]
MRVTLIVGVVLVLALGVGMGRGEETPITFVKVAEVNRLLVQGTPVVFVDVRSHQEYLARHIKEAVSIPLSSLEERYREIPRQGLVVLY